MENEVYIKPLQFMRDLYPTGIDNMNTAYSVPDPSPISLSQAYTHPSQNVVRLRGKYPQNIINFQIESLSSIKVATVTEPSGIPLSFEFIVNFPGPNGEPDLWTSPTFMNKITQAQAQSNPYYRLDKLPIVVVPFENLVRYSQIFFNNESYAGVLVTDTVNTKDEMLLHVNWMVSSDEYVRPVTGNGVYAPLGFWDIIPDPTLGADFAKFIDDLNIGLNADITSDPRSQNDGSSMNDTTGNSTVDQIIADIQEQLNLQNGLTTPQGNDTGTGFNIITPISTNPLDPLNQNGTQTNDVNYNIFNAFTDTNLTITNPDGSISVYDSNGNIISNSGTASPISVTTTLGTNTTGNTGIGGYILTGTNPDGGIYGGNASNSGGIQSGGAIPIGNSGGRDTSGILGPIAIATYGTSGITMGNYYPFTNAGSRAGEVRSFNGMPYVWNGKRWTAG